MSLAGAQREECNVIAKSPVANSWPVPPLAQPWQRSNFRCPAIAQAAPFKLGLLTVKTGPLAQGGIQMEQGVVTFLKEKNYT